AECGPKTQTEIPPGFGMGVPGPIRPIRCPADGVLGKNQGSYGNSRPSTQEPGSRGRQRESLQELAALRLLEQSAGWAHRQAQPMRHPAPAAQPAAQGPESLRRPEREIDTK